MNTAAELLVIKQKNLDLGFLLIDTCHQDVPKILNKLRLPGHLVLQIEMCPPSYSGRDRAALRLRYLQLSSD